MWACAKRPERMINVFWGARIILIGWKSWKSLSAGTILIKWGSHRKKKGQVCGGGTGNIKNKYSLSFYFAGNRVCREYKVVTTKWLAVPSRKKKSTFFPSIFQWMLLGILYSLILEDVNNTSWGKTNFGGEGKGIADRYTQSTTDAVFLGRIQINSVRI